MRIRIKDTPWFIWTIFALCLGFLIFEIGQIIQYAFQPNQMDFGEGFTMYTAKLWAHGQFQWNPSSQPYMTLIYGVVYPELLKPFVLLFGPDLRVGRVYCLIASLIIVVFIFLIARMFSRNKVICLIAALMPMLHPAYREWIMQARCDMVAIMFSVIGVYIAVRWKSDKKIFWSVPLFLLALFTKQTAVVGVGAVCLYLLVTNRKIFLIYTGIFLVSLVALILFGNALTHGQFFMQIWSYDKTVPITWLINTVTLNNKYIFYPFAIILPFIAIVLVLKPPLAKQYLIPVLWLVVSAYVTCVLLYRKGGFINYGMEFIIVSGLVFALLLEQASKVQVKKLYLVVIICLFIPFQILQSFSVNPIPMPDKAYAVETNAVKVIIKNTDAPILTENAGLVLSTGKTPYYEPFVYTNLENLGYFNQNIIVADLDNQRLDYLVLQYALSPGNYDTSHFTPEVVSAIQNNYHIIYGYQSYSVYNYCVYESNSLYDEQHK